MFTAILWTLFLSGIVFGRLFIKNRVVRQMGSLTMPTVLLLLFLFGSEIGSDERVMLSLPTLGARALLMAVSCVAGSVILSGLVYRMIRNRIKK